jgi:hypothetical protein
MDPCALNQSIAPLVMVLHEAPMGFSHSPKDRSQVLPATQPSIQKGEADAVRGAEERLQEVQITL